jgi:hypothetical protein
MSESLLSQATDSSQSTEAATTPTESAPVFIAPEWAKGINVDQEILKAPMFSSIKSMDDVVKGYYNAQKMVGSDKIVVPGKNSSSDDWRNFYVKGGLPEKFDDYKVELPKSFDNQEFNSEFLKTAYENNVNPAQLQKLTEMFEKSNEKLISDYEASQAQEIQNATNALKQEWGQGFEKQLARANRVVKHFGGEEMHKAVLGSDLANNSHFIKLMAKIGEKMTGEDTFQYESTSTFGMTKDEARSKMNAIYGDMNSPYFNRDHAQHKEFLDKMLKFQEVLSGN